MLNHIAIGTSVTLDLQTRMLTRTDTQQTVTLPQSACLCLAALAEAQGEVLSQEQLMEIGWRSAGVEVTDNSVRVMITKLRRAFTQLNLQEAITLIAVTRSGYRLLVREASSELQQAKPCPCRMNRYRQTQLKHSRWSPTRLPVGATRLSKSSASRLAACSSGW